MNRFVAYLWVWMLVAASSATVVGQGVAPGPAAPTGEPPRMKLSDTKWDFGTVWHGEQLKHKLVISNEGKGELRILRVSASCGCTAAQPQRQILPAGESTDVEITFNTHGKQGNVSSSVTILSNDPSTPSAMFNIQGVVKRAVVMEPMGGIVMRSVDTAGTLTAKVTLTNNEPDPMKPKIETSSADLFDITLKEVTVGKVYEVSATTKRALGRGTTSGYVSISTGIAREPVVNIPIQVRVMDKLNLVPPVLMFMKEDDKPANRVVNIEYYGDISKFKIDKVECKDPKVQATLGPIGPPPDWQQKMQPAPTGVASLSLVIPPGREIPNEGVAVEIFTNDPEYARVEVVLTTDPAVFQQIMYKPAQLPPAAKAAPAVKP